MRRFKFPSRVARIPFYCGIVVCSGFYPLSYADNIPERFMLALSVPWLLLIPFFPLLLVPALQLRSWKLAIKALLFGPIFMIANAFLSIFFSVDNRTFSAMPNIVPGCMCEMNPGGPIVNLLPDFVIFVALVLLGIRWIYRSAGVFQRQLAHRAFYGGMILMVVLCFDIWLTSDEDQLRTNWIIGSMTWIFSNGLFWMFVLGTPPEKISEKTEAPVAAPVIENPVGNL